MPAGVGRAASHRAVCSCPREPPRVPWAVGDRAPEGFRGSPGGQQKHAAVLKQKSHFSPIGVGYQEGSPPLQRFRTNRELTPPHAAALPLGQALRPPRTAVGDTERTGALPHVAQHRTAPSAGSCRCASVGHAARPRRAAARGQARSSLLGSVQR